ncbi:MAG: DUF4105 domain-containing protein [Cryobacterium sp.]|nr:DUF4105 domain-containing protein [Oligoflexia bacterium]
MVRLLNFIILGLSLGGPAAVSARDLFIQPSELRLKEIAHSSEWRKLLHYHSPFLRSERSDIDESSFFISPTGKADSISELKATLDVFLIPEEAVKIRGRIGQPSACAFPARKAFLSRNLGEVFLESAEKVMKQSECKDYQTWSAGIRAHGVTLVFSSAYPNNPASMFGHTFLRLDRTRGDEEGGRPQDYLSYGVNFSAQVSSDENPFKYAFYGLFGGYTGRYDLAPYYRKVNEYAFSESRDLWEYRMRFTEPEVAQLVRHIWELYGAGGTDYYFLDENCSYQILTAIEAVKPGWDLTHGLFLSTLPIESVKQVVRIPDAVSSVHYRPSLKNRMVQSLNDIPGDSQRKVRDFFSPHGKDLNENGRPRLHLLSLGELDALSFALTYESQRTRASDQRMSFMKEIYAARSEKGVILGGDSSNANDLRDERRPDFSHRSSRLTLGFGVVGRDSQWKIGLSAFEHDFLDRTPSFNTYSEVKLLGMQATLSGAHGIRLEALEVIGMASFAPYSVFNDEKSWRLNFEWSRFSEAPLPSGGRLHANGGYGLGTEIFSPESLAYALATLDLEQSRVFRHGVRLSPGVEFGVLAHLRQEKNFIQMRVLPSLDILKSRPGRFARLRAELLHSWWMGADVDIRMLGAVERSELSAREWISRAEVLLNFRF